MSYNAWYELVLLFECRIRSKDIIVDVKYLYINMEDSLYALIKLIVARKKSNISRIRVNKLNIDRFLLTLSTKYRKWITRFDRNIVIKSFELINN